jgi:hypothetical protein
MMLLPGSPQWVKERIGKLTASRMADVLSVSKAKGKEGTPLKSRIDYAMELVAERMTDSAMNHFVSDDMKWGLEWEAAAIEEYEAVTGRIVEVAGWHSHPHIENFGGTPDGLVGREGTIQVKCPRSNTYVSWRLAGVVPEQHIPQMIVELLVTRREWCDFVAFDPRVQNPRGRLFIRRFTPTPEQRAWVESEAVRFLKEVDAMFTAVVEAPVESGATAAATQSEEEKNEGL